MKVAFDITQTGRNKAGCGFYAASIADQLIQAHADLQLHLLTSWGDFFHDPAMATSWPYRGEAISYGPRILLRSGAESHWNDAETLNRSLAGCDLVHINNFWHPPFQLPCRSVYTVYDVSFAENPQWTTEINRLGCFTGMQRAAAFADRFVAISDSTKQRFLRHFPHISPERVSVIYPASRFQGQLKDLQPSRPGHAVFQREQPFLLSVGTIEPRKNQRFLLEVYKRFRERSEAKLPLVLAGGEGWLMEEFDQLIQRHPYARDIIKLGYVSDEEVAWLYSHCSINLYPSLYEGFGLPVLEGMGFGAPVISSNTTSMPEIVADAGLLRDPADLEGWCTGICEIIEDPEQRLALSQAARSRAASFDWRRSGEQLLELYRSMEAGAAD